MADERLFRELDGKYRILAQLGEGGTAYVWLAVARGPSGFNKLVVLKTIRKELLNDDAVVEMFLAEARLAARLNHPNVVQTNEVFEQANHPVIVMEYLDGLPFSAVLDRQRQGDALALAMLLRVVSEALSGLDAAHKLSDYDGSELNVVHRDVSPHNLFITFAGQVKVLDFGIAQLTSSRDVTETGQIKGKLRYMAPEQISGERVDRRADIYSVGVILWEIATAERMWPNSMPYATILKRILAHELPAVPKDAASEDVIDAELLAIINKALSAHPEDRYSSALELQNALDDYIGTLGGSIRNRDVGRALSKMFDDVRKERAQMIEEQLARTEPIDHKSIPPAPFPELTSFSNTRGATPSRPAEKKFPTTLLLLGFVLALATFMIGLFWPQKVVPLDAGEAVLPQASPPIRETKKSSEPSEVQVRLVAFPKEALLFLDGSPLAQNPYHERHARELNRSHLLRVEAKGFLPEEHELRFSESVDLTISLNHLSAATTQAATPQATAPQATAPQTEAPRNAKPPALKANTEHPLFATGKPSQSAPTTAPAPSPRPESSAENCSPPYYFDHRGVKKYKAQCL